jgi:glycosyltransferase involved in cell wall biosynthesis
MAVYNGARFIAEQVESILQQIGQSDELIIVDDASTDESVAIVKSFREPRVRLLCNTTNLGVVETFERALSEANGELIFLSDQDDIWEPNKVATTIQVFASNPWARLVVSDASLVDEAGVFLANSYYQQRGKFGDGLLANFSQCRYLGCVMAFRSSLIPDILPFPKGLDVLHDIWIGMRNKLSGGETYFIDRPLVRYRRHATNVTGRERLSRLRQFRTRFHLVLALTRFRAQS